MDNGDLEDTHDRHSEDAEGGFQPEFPLEARYLNDGSHLNPSRWWFASSAFPMFAGTLGPVASAFSICALVRPWRQQLPPGATVEEAVYIPDPPWLTAVNAIQLVVALVSNAFLLLNMTKRVRFSIAQPVTIIGWYMSAICLVCLNVTAAGPLLASLTLPHDQYIWSQAFFYGIWAAILYFVDASLMAVTFWGASSGHYGRHFNLTRSQRTLMLQTMVVIMYLLLGALIFSHIESWNYLDAVYWADQTLFTIGFGDYVITTNLGRALLFPYALVGIISVGLVIISIRSLILERGKRHLDARVQERHRRKTIRILMRDGQDDVLTPIQRGPTVDAGKAEQGQLPPGEFERRRSEFELMRKIQKTASLRRRWIAMAISTGSLLLLWLVGALVFMECEKHYQLWTYFDSVYFCFVSWTTIGYGDVTPISNAGKSFFVFWSLLALPTMTILISNAESTVVKFVQDATITLGNITILPGDEGFTGSVKHVAHQLTCGRAFKDAQMARIYGPRGSTGDEPATSASRGRVEDPNGHSASGSSPSRGDTPRGCHDATTQGRGSLSCIRTRLDALPSGHDLHLLLISEIQRVTEHIREARPRHYTFEEWAWYLGLIGEDERDPERHRKAWPKEKRRRRHGRKKARQQRNGHSQTLDPTQDERFKWSWVGDRNPLMGGQEESEWILEKLMDKLRESLRMAARGA